jgi:hypothetical protein
VGIAVFFALLDTATTLLGISWWPAHPGTLAWVLLGLQAAACLSLVARRRAPLLAIAVLGGFTLAVTLLIWPADALTPANMSNVWRRSPRRSRPTGPSTTGGTGGLRSWPSPCWP